jgi:hypothetical protein
MASVRRENSKAAFADRQVEVLGHLVLVDDASDSHADGIFSSEPSAPDHVCDLRELTLGGFEEALPLSGAKFGEVVILARDQPLAGEVGMLELEEVTLVEDPKLQMSGVDQRANRSGLERGDPGYALVLGERRDLLLRNHSAVADDHHASDSELRPRLVDLGQERFRIARVAFEYRDRDRASTLVGQKAVVDL